MRHKIKDIAATQSVQWGTIAERIDENFAEVEKNVSDFATKDYVTTAQLNDKVDKVSGKGLSTNDFTTTLKTKLESLKNYDDSELRDALTTLRDNFNELVNGDPTSAIENFNEIIAFLEGVNDNQSLDGIIASIEQQIAHKQATISDLATIRGGAAKGATSVQPADLEGKQDKLVSGSNIKTINGQSLLGSGDITIKGGGESYAGNYPIEEVYSTFDISLYPNTYYIATITGEETFITLEDAENENIVNEYIIEIRVKSEFLSASLHADIVWANGDVPSFDSGKVYVISIVNNLAKYTEFELRE